jgi:hypothetical protein
MRMINIRFSLAACAFAVLLSACGGGDATAPGSGKPGTSGFVVDGYLSGATVTCDINGNGIKDSDEASTTTDTSGFFSFSSPCTSALIATGGTSIDTKLPFTGTLKAPAGSTVITPLTTLIASGISESALKTALGLSTTKTLVLTDPALTKSGSTELLDADLMKKTLVLQQFAQKITEVVAGLATGSADKASIYNEVMAALAQALVANPSLITGATISESSAQALIKAAVQRVAASTTLPAGVKAGVAALNPDSLAQVMAGALKVQGEAILGAAENALTETTKNAQESTAITSFIQAKKDDTALKNAPTTGTASLANDLKSSLSGGSSGCGTTAPTCAPSTVIPSGSTVIYSDAASTAGLDTFPNWGQATQVLETTIASNKSLRYTNLNYQGTVFTPVNVASKGKIHFDMWTPGLTSVQISVISLNPTKEKAITKALTPGAWNSIDIDLTDYTADLTKVEQIKIEATGGGTLYVDNIYFWGTPNGGGTGQACGTTAPTCAPSTVIPSGSTVIYSDAASTAGLDTFPNWGQATQVLETTIASNKSLRYTNLNYQGTVFTPVNVASKGKIHFDMWTPGLTSVQISVISLNPTKEKAITKALTPGAWNSIDIDLTDYTADLTKVEQIKIEATGGGTLYVDNIYFWGTSGSGPGGGTGGALTFSSGFSSAVLTSSGGAVASAGGSNLDNFGCNGSDLFCGNFSGGAGADSYAGFYYQTPSPASALYSQIEVFGPGVTGFSTSGDTGGITIGSQTKVNFTFELNPEWFNSSNNKFGVILTLGKRYAIDGGCRLQLHGVKTPTSAGPTAYSMNLRNDFRVAADCGAGIPPTDVAAALAASPVISSVKFIGAAGGSAILGRNDVASGANLSVPKADGKYPTTVVLKGAITFD